MNWLDARAYEDLARIREAKEKQVYPYFRPMETGGIHTRIDGQPIINFSSNDYLGLTNHPKVKEAAKAAVEKFACGLSSSRVQATTTMHVELEERLVTASGDDAAPVQQQLERVLAALERIDDRSFGLCLRCGATLSNADLDAEPELELCPLCRGDEASR